MKKWEPCPVCQSVSEIEGASFDGTLLFHVICPRCGQYQIEYVAKQYLNVDLDPTKVAVLSHAIYRMQRNKVIPSLDQLTIARLLQNPLPRPAEQMNSFILWLGENTPGLGEKVDINELVMQAEIGARTPEGVDAIVDHLIEKNFVERKTIATTRPGLRQYNLTLKIEGWEYYESLKRGNISSRKAFMAMPFGYPELDELVSKYFRPAVKATGFDLYRLDDSPKAGLIDDRLTVEIRTSRFLIADLTHQNRGAYWEAGFAQGLGRPVFYTCEKEQFKNTHFDTNHHLTIIWDRNDLGKAAIDLKNTIRETLPDEAKMTDDE